MVVEEGAFEVDIGWRTIRVVATEDDRDSADINESQLNAIGIGIGSRRRSEGRILGGLPLGSSETMLVESGGSRTKVE